MRDAARILIAGVPFGCDNVGDEAILECGVAIVREACPGCAITVSTNDGPATAKKLGVRTCPLLGFPPDPNRAHMFEEIEAHDVFIWLGATGLSDYPEIPLELMRLAQNAGKDTILWGVGMNRELNPALYRLWPGKRRSLLRLACMLTLNAFDVVAAEEERRMRRARRKIAARLNAASLVVVRDADSREEVLRCGVRREVVVGMDSAIELEPAALEDVNLSERVRLLLNSGKKRFGVCISAQRKVRDEARLIDYLNTLVAEDDVRILFVPMNPITDNALMEGMHARMKHPERAAVLQGRHEPGEVLAVLSQLDAVVSSRLHLLILAMIAGVPIVGISRGSKIDTFLREFGLESAGTTEAPDFDRLFAESVRALDHREELIERIAAVRAGFRGRLGEAKIRLADVLEKNGGAGAR